MTVLVRDSTGAPRDVTSATGTLTVYRDAPSGGVGGTVLFTKTLTGSTGGLMVATLTALDTALPGSFYAEVSVTQAGITDPWHGTIRVEGQ